MRFSRQTFRTWRFFGTWCILGCVLSSASVAQSQPVDPQRAIDAQALFEQAITEMDAGQYPSACKKLEEVTRLVPDGVGGKYALGECYERQGKLASAWTQFSFAQQVAARLGQTERAEDARAKADSLKPKLASLTVLVPVSLRSVSDLVVVRDGVELREPQWGTALYVDAGQHEVVVTAPGHTTWRRKLEVLTDGIPAKFTIPDNAITPAPKEQAPTAIPAVPLVYTPTSPDRSWQMPTGRAITGAGALAIAAGALFGGIAISKKDESNEGGHCDATTNRCDDLGLALRKQALGLATTSTALITVGTILTAGGVILWVTSPSEKKPAMDKRSEPKEKKTQAAIEMGVGWLGLVGRF